MAILKPTDGILRAITVREPWATLCCMGVKTCEIRSWNWPSFCLPMTLAIHASADDKTIAEDIEWVTNKFDNAYWAFENPECEPCVPGKDFFYAQTIVGLVDVIGAIAVDPKWSKKEKRKRIAAAGFDKMYVEWAEGPYSFLLANPRRFKTGIQCRGNLKIWKLTPEIQAYVESAELLPVPIGEEFGLLPTKPHGIVKCLGKPNDPESDEAAFAELDRLDAEDEE